MDVSNLVKPVPFHLITLITLPHCLVMYIPLNSHIINQIKAIYFYEKDLWQKVAIIGPLCVPLYI